MAHTRRQGPTRTAPTPHDDAPPGAGLSRRGLLGALPALAWSGAAGAAAPTASDRVEHRGVAPRPLVFPADFGAHPDTRIEWWYVTGWLGTAEAPRYGFQLTFFRSRTDVDARHPSAFAATQLLFAHAALSDVGQRRQHHDQRMARAGFGLAQAAVGDTDVRLRDWPLQRRPGPAGASSIYRAELHAGPHGGSNDWQLALQLATTQPPLLQGDAGYSRKGPRPGQASHYYSQPQLDVAARLQIDGHSLDLAGRAWLDHEWSNSLLDPGAVGWDWIGINLFDGGALTAFRLRRADGSTLWAGGSLRGASGATGETRSFKPDEVRFTPLQRWSSPATAASYPVQWQVDTPAGRHQVRALFEAQELDSRASTGTVYWEGLSELLDQQGRRIGLGYLEMTGYVGRLAMP